CVQVLVVLLAAGCSQGVALHDLPTRAAKTYCAKYYECCMAAELSGTPLGPDQATCETNLAAALGGTQNEQAGRVTYHADLMAGCLDAYAKLTCQQLKSNATSTISDCGAAFEPKVAAGAACGQDRECIGGSCEGAMIGSDGHCATFA